jgi:hypothetical protein
MDFSARFVVQLLYAIRRTQGLNCGDRLQPRKGVRSGASAIPNPM